jgi:hypothetical protein
VLIHLAHIGTKHIKKKRGNQIMAFVTKNGFDVEHGSSLVVYENLFPNLKHIKGKGVTEEYVSKEDIMEVDTIDITRILPKKIHYRAIGSSLNATNGKWMNKNNANGGPTPESVHYSLFVNFVYDEDTTIPFAMIHSTQVNFEQYVNKNITDCFAQTLNAFTWANQIKAFFDDNTAVAKSVFKYDANTTPAQAFQLANANLQSDKSIGAFTIPMEERQAFIDYDLNAALKAQYATNASEAAAQINATGFMNPFTQAEGKRIDSRTGICGIYDGVLMTLVNDVERENIYEVLGVSSDATTKAVLDKIKGFIVYGGSTLRGIAMEGISANEHPFQHGSVVLKPFNKFGVKCLSGKSIKVITNDTIADADLTTVKAALSIAVNIESATSDPDYQKGTQN